MKRVLLFILSLAVAIPVYSQQDTITKRRYIGTNVTRARDAYMIANDPSISAYSKDLSHEAVEAGWGTSKWDKGTFYPEKNLEEARRIEREEYYAKQFKIIGMVVGITAIVCILAYIISRREKKKKNSDWNSSSTLD